MGTVVHVKVLLYHMDIGYTYLLTSRLEVRCRQACRLGALSPAVVFLSSLLPALSGCPLFRPLLYFVMLASVADSLKIYEFDSTQQKASLSIVSERDSSSFQNKRLLTVAWNHTNQVVATAGENRVIQLVQVTNGQLLTEVPFSSVATERVVLNSDTHIKNNIVALSFSNSSRYLASSSGSCIHVWDLKKRNLKSMKMFGKSNISCSLFLPDGSKVISGNRDGKISVWAFDQSADMDDSSSEISSSQFLPTPITSIDVSLGTQTKLASGYLEGATAVWDVATGSLLRRQGIHEGRLTGLTFSPKNSRLLATCGYDGRINLVDTASKSTSDPSASVSVGHRLTSVSFCNDAIHTAVGTENGHIFMYDWRNLRTPVTSVEAHTPSPVLSLKFQGLIRNAASVSSTVGSSPVSRSTSQSPSPIKKSPTRVLSQTQEASSIISAASNISDVTEKSHAVKSASQDPLSSPERNASETKNNVSNTTTTKPEIILPVTAPTSSSSIGKNMDRSRVSTVDESVPPPPPAARHPPVASSSALAKVVTATTSSVDQQPLTQENLKEALDIFRYDIHKELQGIIREQVRQFEIAKQDNATLIQQMSEQLKDLLESNRELREENERLRHIY